MAEETQLTAKTAMVQISTANSNLDGTGTLGTLITAGANGTYVKAVRIKAITNVTGGMIRLFITTDMGDTRLFKEIPILPKTKASINPAFQLTLNIDLNLEAGFILKAATENAETFNVIAECLEWSYYATSVRTDTTKYTASMGVAQMSVANSNLDGTGTLYTAFTAGSSATYKGASVSTITIKGKVNTTPGMIRLYLYSGSGTKYLFDEIIVQSVTQSATDQAFVQTIEYADHLDIQAGYSILASTQNAQNFNVIVDANNWNYYS